MINKFIRWCFRYIINNKNTSSSSADLETEDSRGLFLFEQESVVMRKWQILEFDGKPYYAFVPENVEPIDMNNIPVIDDDDDDGEESLNTSTEKLLACKIEQTNNHDDEEDESMGNDESFYDYQYNHDASITNDESMGANDMKPILLNGISGESIKDATHGDLYQVKVDGSFVTLEKLAENVINVKTGAGNGNLISDAEDDDEEDIVAVMEERNDEEDEEEEDEEVEEEEVEEEEEMEMEEKILTNNNPVKEHQDEPQDEPPQEVPHFIDVDSMDSQAIEYASDNEENVDDVQPIHELVIMANSSSGLESIQEKQRTKYRNILPKVPAASFKCKACAETFNSAIAFRKHVAWTHKKKVCIQEDGAYICAVCDYRTLKKSLFAAHLERKHETWPRKGQNNLLFPCAVCGFVCRSKHSLQSHFIRKHTDNYEHQCKFCPKKFKVKGDLTNHVRFHHKEKPINCDVCGKLCQNSGSLYVHQKWAHYKPKFECKICKRRMVTQENLDQHMVTQHEKREKIVCAECGKTFTKKDSFKRHMAVHTGSKPHHCPICNKPFARQSQLRQHVLIHTGKRPFVCDICGKAFTQKPGLICHRKTHPGPHPPLPVMPIADLVKEFTAEYLQENGQLNDADADIMSE